MAKYPDIRSAAIPAMKIVQAEHGWLSPTALEQAACVMRLTPAYMVSVASFYDMFELAPQGGRRTCYVCTNISCSLLGADELYAHVKDVLGGDPDFNVRAFECLGACEIAPDGLGQRQVPRTAPPRTTSSGSRDDVKAGRRRSPGQAAEPERKAASKHWQETQGRQTSTRSSSRTSTSRA